MRRRSPGSRRPTSRPTCRSCRRLIGARSPSSSRRRKCSTVSTCGRSGRQRSACSSTWRATSSPAGRDRLHYFLINKGPWSRLDHNEPFVPGAPPKPAGANFYPAGATKAEIEKWIQSLPEAERARATGFFTVIRRAANGQFTAVPYSLEYQNELAHAAALLREAADLSAEPTLKAFLTKRAHAFLSNDYYDSDVAWMELKGAIEPTIGPYEVYEDEFFNYKAAFESFITLRDDAESAKLTRFGGELQGIENVLPIDREVSQPEARRRWRR